MRVTTKLGLAVIVAALGCGLGNGSARAENRTFVIVNAPDGYGVDQCLATGGSCGSIIANAFCQSKDFVQAASFRKVAATEITASVAVAVGSTTKDEFVAIECQR